MPLQLFNTLSRQKQPFAPIAPPVVNFYTCGPTVYNFAHIGNMRAYISSDLLRRWLAVQHRYDVCWVLNITDIDDKTIRGSGQQYPELDPHEALQKFTALYAGYFFEDLKTLNIPREVFYANPRATDYIPSMQNLIRDIFKKGYAKVIGGSVFFDVEKWSNDDTYGKLLPLDLANLKSGTRTLADETEKDNLSDFVLWKERKPGEPFWDFDLGGQALPGRPGWHLECSAMEKELFGLPFDIHSGGVDLIFPHHEDEIAQSACGYGCEPTRYWFHNEHLLVEGKKMSKSLGNYFTLRDLVAKGHHPDAIRFFLVTNHYRSKLNLSHDSLVAAANALERIRNYMRKVTLSEPVESCLDSDIKSLYQNEKANFVSAMDDDLNTPVAIAGVYRFFSEASALPLTADTKRLVGDFAAFVGDVLGVSFLPVSVEPPPEVVELAEQRNRARLEKNWPLSDRLRDRLLEQGFAVRDTADGFELVPHQ